MSKKEAFEDLLRRRDEKIEELKKNNELLIKVAIKRAQALQDITERLKKLDQENEKLKEKLKGKLKKKRIKKKK